MITIVTNIFFNDAITVIVITVFIYVDMYVICVLVIGVSAVSAFNTVLVNTVAIAQTDEIGNRGFDASG